MTRNEFIKTVIIAPVAALFGVKAMAKEEISVSIDGDIQPSLDFIAPKTIEERMLMDSGFDPDELVEFDGIMKYNIND